MEDFSKNNLAKASSTYLQQHSHNPVWWQEWNEQTLNYARDQNRPLFVSVGYATCHWCHVMAAEAFNDRDIAEYLNRNFICIKVDREQRPDIDSFLMSFLVETQGSGGWPLNVFVTPDIRPFLAVTYLPAKQQQGLPSFVEVCRLAKDAFEEHRGKIPTFHAEPNADIEYAESDVAGAILAVADQENSGFGSAPKFPPHSTLLFLLSFYDRRRDLAAARVIESTLDAMMLRGLHDHLQGGFFRYCVDAHWTIPHFEKMLYDQAMLLWVYSSAYKALGKQEYGVVCERIVKCLGETFMSGEGLFYSAHDADTSHHEGGTYLWDTDELRLLLSQKEFSEFESVYDVSTAGNFTGTNHLIKRKAEWLPEIEEKLLNVRRIRPQPFTDRKIVTSWNCLAGIGLIMAYRSLGDQKLLAMSANLFDRLIEKHYLKGKLCHSSLGGKRQEAEFLQDYAALLLFATYLHEEGYDREQIINEMAGKLNRFRKLGWIESSNEDFVEVSATAYDHPIPSSISMAEFALLRASVLLGRERPKIEYGTALESDFRNIAAFYAKGNWHEIGAEHKISWKYLPLNSIQRRTSKVMDCFGGKCLEFENEQEAIESLAGA